MKTYNVNDNINFTQNGLILNGTINRVIRTEADGSAYYEVQFSKEGKCVVCTDEIEEGSFSAFVFFYRDGKRKCVELCSVKEAWGYVLDVVSKHKDWHFDTITRGRYYNC